MNMNRTLKQSIIGGFIFVCILGTLAHFFYQWSGNAFVVGLFTPVNESVWEHIKLLFFPMLLYALFMQYRCKADYPCLWSGLCAGILLGCITIPVIYYTYTGILGYHLLAVDIATLYIAIFLAFFTAYKRTLNCKAQPYRLLLTILIIVTAAAFLLFTYHAPGLPLFQSL